MKMKMKKTSYFITALAICLFAAASICAADEKIYSSEEVSVRASILYETVQNTPLTGIVTKSSDKGVLQKKTSYKNGKKDGVEQRFHSSGVVASETH